MPMAADDIVTLIEEALPGAVVEMRDLAGDTIIGPPRLRRRNSPG